MNNFLLLRYLKDYICNSVAELRLYSFLILVYLVKGHQLGDLFVQPVDGINNAVFSLWHVFKRA